MATNLADQYLPLPVFFFLPSVYFVVHAIEELPTFGPWASKHFAPLSTGMFATVHIPLILLVFLASYEAAQSQKHGAWVIFAVALQIQFGLNAPFHLITAALFREYAPGMMTASSIGLLLTFYMLARVSQAELLSQQELVMRRDETGLELGMEETYTEGVATHGGPEPCGSARKGRAEALDRGRCRLGH